MYRVTYPFLFRGKRYKTGQQLPDDHTAVRYRTQFVELLEEEVEALLGASTELSEVTKTEIGEEKIPTPEQLPQVSEVIISEIPPAVTVNATQLLKPVTQPIRVVQPAKTVSVSQPKRV